MRKTIAEIIKSHLSGSGIVFLIIILAIAYGQNIVIFIQKNLIKDQDAFLIITEYYSAMFAGSMIGFDFLIGFWIAANLAELKKSKTKRKKQNEYISLKRQTLVLSAVLMLFILVQVAFVNNYTQIFRDRISYHNGFLMKRSDYGFNDVRGITIGYFHGLYAKHANYELLMKDGREINIASGGIYPEMFYQIDRLAPESAVRKCETSGISRVINRMPEKYQEYYRNKYLK